MWPDGFGARKWRGHCSPLAGLFELAVLWGVILCVFRWSPSPRRSPDCTEISASFPLWIEQMWVLLSPLSMEGNTPTFTQVHRARLSLDVRAYVYWLLMPFPWLFSCCRVDAEWPGEKWESQVLQTVYCFPWWQVSGLLWSLGELYRD